MKRNLIKIGLVSLFMAVATVVSAQAQVSQIYRAEIPFDFSVNGVEFKAGSYSIRMLNSNTNSGPVILQGRTGGDHRILSSGSGGSRSKGNEGKLVFVQIGTSYSLKEVLTPTFGTKLRIRNTVTDAERLAMSGTKTATVALARE